MNKKLLILLFFSFPFQNTFCTDPQQPTCKTDADCKDNEKCTGGECVDKAAIQAAKDALSQYCGQFNRDLQDCSNISTGIQNKQSEMQNSVVYKEMDNLKKNKEQYDKLQKNAADCRQKSASKCKDSATSAFNALTDLNTTIAQVMTLVHAKMAKMPMPVTKSQTVEGTNISYTIISNYVTDLKDCPANQQCIDKNGFNNAVSDYIGIPDLSDKQLNDITNLLDKITAKTTVYKQNYDTFESCLNSASHDCDDLTKQAYQALDNMNKSIINAMNFLHGMFPQLVDIPKTEVVKLDMGYQFTKINNFDADKFAQAVKAYKDRLLPDVFIQEAQQCSDLFTKPRKEFGGLTEKEDCEKWMTKVFGEAKARMWANLGTSTILNFGAFEVGMGIAAAFGVPGLIAGGILIGLSFIPGVNEAFDSAAEWIIDGLFGSSKRTAYYKRFLLLFEDPIETEVIRKAEQIKKERIEKEPDIQREKIPPMLKLKRSR